MTVKSGSSTLQKKTICKTAGLAVQIFPATTRTFTKDNDTVRARHGMCKLTHGTAGERHGCGTDAACYV
jgi:hypothetical protein